VHGWSSG